MHSPPFVTPPYSPDLSKTEKKSSFRRIIFFSIVILLLLLTGSAVTLGAGFLIKAQQTSSAISLNKHPQSNVLGVAQSLLSDHERAKLKGEEEGRINILLLGKASKDYPGRDLTDTIIIASLNTHKGRVSLLSLPRDLYVPIADTQTFTKINALYGIGEAKEDPFEIIRTSLENITGLTLHYSIVVDYQAFVEIVNAIGGVNVTVERDIYDARFPGPNYSYQTFELKKGFHTLDGETALKYVRERHSDPMGDFGRAHRQQQTIKAVKNKIFSTETFLNPFAIHKLMSALQENIRTDIGLSEIEGFIDIIRNTDMENMETVVVDAWKPESLLRVSHVYLDNGQRMFTLAPRTGTFDEIHELAENIFDRSKIQKRRESILEENPSLLIISPQSFSQTEKFHSLLKEMGFQNIEIRKEYETGDAPPTSSVFTNEPSSFPFSLSELVLTVPARLDKTPLPSSQSGDKEWDIVITLGQDAIDRHNWEEISIEEYQKNGENK